MKKWITNSSTSQFKRFFLLESKILSKKKRKSDSLKALFSAILLHEIQKSIQDI